MKKKLIDIAGLTLAATICVFPVFAQKPPGAGNKVPPPAPGHPPRVESRVEIESDDDGPIAIARAVGDADRTVRRIFAGGGDNPDRPLIITSSQPDEKILSNLDEDLNIMARVLDKSVDRGSDDGDRKAMGIHLWAIGGGNRNARNLYLDGYGALFILNVNMQLQPPPTKPQVEEKKETGSSTWDEARNELYGRDDERREGTKRKLGDQRPAPPFDAARVEELKKDLIEALKNATHIRGLKDNESVTVVVQGSGADRNFQRARTNGPKGQLFESDVFSYAFSGGGPASRSVMTLRAKKGDIDAFAKGKTDLDDFRKKVSIATYQSATGGNGEGMPSR